MITATIPAQIIRTINITFNAYNVVDIILLDGIFNHNWISVKLVT